jgi:hypothetical protein
VRPRPAGVDAVPTVAGWAGARVATVLITLFGLSSLGAACPPPLFEPDARLDPTTLPEDPLAILQLADEWSQPGTSKERKLDALIALDRAADLSSDPYITQVIRARTYFRLVEESEGDAAWGDWVEQGVEAAEAAVAANPDRVEGHYFLATLLGRQAERATVGALDMIPRILEEAERCEQLDRTYDHCGPLVALGMLYIAAPPWPQSIGDAETGIDYLRESAACSDYPVNRVMLAEALLDQGEFEEPRELLRWVLARPPEGDWGVAGNRWRPIARELLQRAEHPGE